MNRKLLIRVVPLLVTVAFALMATAAQASTPHWFSNSVKLVESNGDVQTEEEIGGQEAVRVVSMKGTLELKGETGIASGGDLTCDTSVAGWVWNPVGGGRGKGNLELFTVVPTSCTGNACPPGVQVNVAPASLPWPLELTGTDVLTGAGGTATTFRSNIGTLANPIRLITTCSGLPGAALFEGEDNPLAPSGPNKGSSATSPGHLEWDQFSGELKLVDKFGGSQLGTSKTIGELEIIGFNSNELINVK